MRIDMGKMGIILMTVGGIIVILSLIYEFFYGGEEGINGVIIGVGGALIGAELFSTTQIINAIRNLRIDLRGDIREARERVEKGIERVEKGTERIEKGIERVEKGTERIERGIERVEKGVEERTDRILEKLP